MGNGDTSKDGQIVDHPDKTIGRSAFGLGPFGRDIVGVRLGSFGGGVGALQHGKDGLDSFENSVRIVALPKGWQDHLLDDVVGALVGQGSFQTVAHFDAHHPALWGNNEKYAVITSFLPDPPVVAELIAIVGDVITLEIVA